MNSKNQIKIFDNINILAEEFSSQFISEVNSFLEKKKKINVALSGGSTPKYFFRKLVLRKEKLDWNKIFLYWGDERCVAPGDSESNFGMTQKNLLNYIAIPPDNVKRILGEENPEEEAKRYSEVIRNNLPGLNGFPSFDIMILGLGEDGHTASIFPDQIKLLNSDNICEVAYHSVTKQKRITITGNVINNSLKTFFLISGKNKSSVVSEIFNENGNYLKYPAYYIKPYNGRAVWFLDKEAAFELTN